MADLSEIQASQSVKIAGAGPSTGIETNWAQVDSNGGLSIAGEGTAGTPTGGVVTVQGATGMTPIVSQNNPITPSSPTTATIGVSSGIVLASNANRKGLTIVNVSINKVSFGLGAAAVLNSGITLYPGGVWVMDTYTFTTAAINGIAGAASSVVSIQEFTP